MGIFYRRAKLVLRKIIRERAQGKILSAQIYRVRAEPQRNFQFFKIARRREQFDRFVHSFHRFTESATPSPTRRMLVIKSASALTAFKYSRIRRTMERRFCGTGTRPSTQP